MHALLALGTYLFCLLALGLLYGVFLIAFALGQLSARASSALHGVRK